MALTTPTADQQLDQLLNSDVGSWSAATGIAGPGQALVQQWERGQSGLQGNLNVQAQNIGYYASHDPNLPQTNRAAILRAAQADPRWGQLDATGQQELLQLYNLQQSGFGGNIGIGQVLPVEQSGPQGPTGIGGAPTSGGKGKLSTAQQSAVAQLEATLEGFGFTGQDLSQLVAFATKEVIAGNSAQQIQLDLEQNKVFEAHFPGIAIRRKLGLPPITPAEYLSTIDSYTQTLRQAGLPAGFYDTPADFAQLIGNDVSPTELQDRITNAYDTVKTAPAAVQQAFTSFYGPSGTAALAAYVIDPSRAEPALLKQVQAAQLAGTGTQYGFQVGRSTAEQMAGLNITQSQAQQGFQQAQGYQSLIHGEIGGQGTLGQGQVTAGEFGLTPGSGLLLQQGIEGRQAQFLGGGQALQTTTGITGLGEAHSI